MKYKRNAKNIIAVWMAYLKNKHSAIYSIKRDICAEMDCVLDELKMLNSMDIRMILTRHSESNDF